MSRKLVELACKIADEYGVPRALVCAICEQESSWRQSATRKEEGFYERYIRKLGIEDEDEAWGRATSWGLMQVMGQVAREAHYNGPFGDILADPELALRLGCEHLADKVRRFYEDFGWDGVIAAYNAGSPMYRDGEFRNQRYVDKVKEKTTKYDV